MGFELGVRDVGVFGLVLARRRFRLIVGTAASELLFSESSSSESLFSSEELGVVSEWSVSELSAVGLLTLRHCIRDSKTALCMARRGI